MGRKKRCSTSLSHAKWRLATRGLTARGREKAVKLLEEDEIKLDGLTARGREKAG